MLDQADSQQPASELSWCAGGRDASSQAYSACVNITVAVDALLVKQCDCVGWLLSLAAPNTRCIAPHNRRSVPAGQVWRESTRCISLPKVRAAGCVLTLSRRLACNNSEPLLRRASWSRPKGDGTWRIMESARYSLPLKEPARGIHVCSHVAPLVLEEKAEEGVTRPGARPGAGWHPTGVPPSPRGPVTGRALGPAAACPQHSGIAPRPQHIANCPPSHRQRCLATKTSSVTPSWTSCSCRAWLPTPCKTSTCRRPVASRLQERVNTWRICCCPPDW